MAAALLIPQRAAIGQTLESVVKETLSPPEDNKRVWYVRLCPAALALPLSLKFTLKFSQNLHGSAGSTVFGSAGFNFFNFSQW